MTNSPAPAAIGNVLYNATGVWFNDLPMASDKVIGAIYGKRSVK